MRLISKLSIGFAALGAVLVASFGIWVTWRESYHLMDQAQRDVELLADALAVSAENAMRDAQDQDIDETLARIERSRPDSDIAVMTLSGKVTAESFPGEGVPEPQATLLRDIIAGGPPMTLMLRDQEPERIVRVVPLRSDAGELMGALLVSRPLLEVQQNIEAARVEVLIGVLAFSVAALLLGPLLSRRLVGRAMDALLRGLDRARVAPVEADLPIQRRDEFGDLARAIHALSVDLEVARARAREEQALKEATQRALVSADKLAAVGQLAATFAHEVGSPMQVLIGHVETLRAEPNLPDQARTRLEKIARQLQRMTGMVDGLLGLVRREIRARRPLDVGEVVGEVVDLFDLEAERRGIALHLEPVDGLPNVKASQAGLQQIMFNLLNNAFQAEARTVTVRVERGELDAFMGAPARPSVRILVRDDGCGIPEAVVPKVTEPFFSTRRSEQGTGLGLAVVRTIVAEHGGALTLSSTEGQGTLVRVDLPLPLEEP
ncbi:MAG: hypothetical protein EA397_00425 [Deltaproteobacteria bacterium]|nr:MAG: hypothetical protein EA397_00425 [Deltaproteobacteria bacterium]